MIAAALALVANAPAASRKTKPVTNEYHYHALVPLGSDNFEVRGAWRGSITFLASAENPQFEGLQRKVVDDRIVLVDQEGEPLKFYPENVDFRVTASTRVQMAEPDPDPLPLEPKLDENDYLLGLKFRVKVFHGLKQRVMNAPIHMIGVPADLGADERVYRVSATFPKISTQDRVVLEVIAPDGTRICKFHLDLF